MTLGIEQISNLWRCSSKVEHLKTLGNKINDRNSIKKYLFCVFLDLYFFTLLDNFQSNGKYVLWIVEQNKKLHIFIYYFFFLLFCISKSGIVNIRHFQSHNVSGKRKISFHQKMFRQINSLVISLVKTLFSRHFWQKSVRAKFRNLPHSALERA